MRLNPDCIRDILITVEELSGIEDVVVLPSPKHERLGKYNDNEVFYHVHQCEMAGLLSGTKPFGGEIYFVEDLSPAGHEFIANIRQESIWNKTKEAAASIGSFSLSALAQIALGLVQSAINLHLGLNK